MIDLTGKVVLITGGSRGIGAACCLSLAKAGARVAVAYRQNQQAAASVVANIREQGGEAKAYSADLTRAEETESLFDAVLADFGQLDILVANAGIWEGAAIHEMTATQWQRTMHANVDSLYFCCHHAAKHMRSRQTGNIITISSTAGQRGEAHYSQYAASKGAAIALTRALAAELGPYGIRVNSVAPGWVRTDMTHHVFEDQARAEKIYAEIPLRRVADPEDIAGPVLFLASDLAKHVQGAVINVNGGSVLC